MTFCRLIAVLVLIHNTGGLLGAEVRSSIVGGEDARKGGWPWMVYLKIRANGVKSWRCGGTILNSWWVLTAAHCWDKNPPPDVTRSHAWIGTHELQKASARYMAIEFFMSHPRYQAVGGGYVNDISLVKLGKEIIFKFNNVAPVSLPNPTDSFDSSSECWITGWGNIGTNVPLPDPEILQQLRIPIISQSECRAKYPQLTSGVMCAGDVAGGKDACEGDYGGPLVCRGSRGFVQVGIMSYGSPNGCGKPGRPGVYTQVSTYLDFINAYIHHGEEASAEV